MKRLSKDELYDLYWNKGLSTCEIAKTYNIGESTVKLWMSEYDIKRRSLSEARKLHFKKVIDREIREKFSKPSPELAYILGVLLGDGTCYHRKHTGRREGVSYEIQLGVTDYLFAEKFKRALEGLGLKTSIWILRRRCGRKDVYKVTSYSKAFYEFYRSLSLKDIRKFIVGFEPYFVCGFYESEGCITYNKARKQLVIQISNTNYEVIKAIYDIIIDKFGIKCHLYKAKTTLGEKIEYRVVIQGDERCKRFLEIINPVIKNRPKNVNEEKRWLKR